MRRERKATPSTRCAQPLAAVVLAALLALPCAAAAGGKGHTLLRKLDAKATWARDQTFNYEMRIHDPGKAVQRMRFKVKIRGRKRFIKFTYPGDVKGMKVLILSRSRMYTYLPAYRKIRRIASHMRSQSLLGADYSYDDMSTVTYADVFKGRLVKQTAKVYVVDARLRPGKSAAYARIVFYLRKKDTMPVKLMYYNATGTKLKTETRRDYACKQKACTARVMKMVDHTRNNHFTELIRKAWQINTGFSDRVFSKRQLQRAN